jgi:hypothetical protein
MNEHDTIDVLTAIAAYDQRTVGPDDVKAWHAIAQHAMWNREGALRAVVDHYTEQTKRIMPADITQFLREPGESGQRICEY